MRMTEVCWWRTSQDLPKGPSGSWISFPNDGNLSNFSLSFCSTVIGIIVVVRSRDGSIIRTAGGSSNPSINAHSRGIIEGGKSYCSADQHEANFVDDAVLTSWNVLLAKLHLSLWNYESWKSCLVLVDEQCFAFTVSSNALESKCWVGDSLGMPIDTRLCFSFLLNVFSSLDFVNPCVLCGGKADATKIDNIIYVSDDWIEVATQHLFSVSPTDPCISWSGWGGGVDGDGEWMMMRDACFKSQQELSQVFAGPQIKWDMGDHNHAQQLDQQYDRQSPTKFHIWKSPVGRIILNMLTQAIQWLRLPFSEPSEEAATRPAEQGERSYG